MREHVSDFAQLGPARLCREGRLHPVARPVGGWQPEHPSEEPARGPALGEHAAIIAYENIDMADPNRLWRFLGFDRIAARIAFALRLTH